MDTSASPDTGDGMLGSFKPDITCFYRDRARLRPRSVPVLGSAQVHCSADMNEAATFVEVKREAASDCFLDPPIDAIRSKWDFVLPPDKDNDHAQTLGQNMAYASAILRRQHRHCVYSVFLFGPIARLARWDRAGGIVTGAFDIRTRPELLCEFFWLFSQLSDDERGYDHTARLVTSPEEEACFRDTIAKHLERQRGTHVTTKDTMKEHYNANSITSIYIPSPSSTHSSSTKERRLLISRSLTSPLSVGGRSIRLYWAVDREKPGRVLLLKDTWRYAVEGTEGQEGDVIQALGQQVLVVQENHRGTCVVPLLDTHGDVPCATIILDRDGQHAQTVISGER